MRALERSYVENGSFLQPGALGQCLNCLRCFVQGLFLLYTCFLSCSGLFVSNDLNGPGSHKFNSTLMDVLLGMALSSTVMGFADRVD